jgi:rhodanese-related sulfurtransferase
MIKEMTPREFVERRAGGAELTLLDVREDWETSLAPVPADHLHIPMGQIADRLGELDPAQETVVICRSGGRSLQVAHFLSTHGFVSVYNLVGGILAWSSDLDPRIPQY